MRGILQWDLEEFERKRTEYSNVLLCENIFHSISGGKSFFLLHKLRDDYLCEQLIYRCQHSNYIYLIFISRKSHDAQNIFWKFFIREIQLGLFISLKSHFLSVYVSARQSPNIIQFLRYFPGRWLNANRRNIFYQGKVLFLRQLLTF